MADIQSSPKKRAINSPENKVGKQREGLYKFAILRVKEAQEKGFYLEAITLLESLISDRLESRLSMLMGDYSFRTLEKIIKRVREYETDAKLRELVTNDLNAWKEKRNTALHEMVKLAEGDTRTWQDKLDTIKPAAEEGFELFRKIDRRVSSIRNYKHKNGF